MSSSLNGLLNVPTSVFAAHLLWEVGGGSLSRCGKQEIHLPRVALGETICHFIVIMVLGIALSNSLCHRQMAKIKNGGQGWPKIDFSLVDDNDDKEDITVKHAPR